MKYKVYSRREWERLLIDNGYRFMSHANTSHQIWKNDKKNDTVMFPKSMNPMICRRTIKEHKLKVGE
jgi:hypothetical protein